MPCGGGGRCAETRAKTKTQGQDGWRVSWGWLVLCSEKQRILGGAGRLAAVGDLEVEEPVQSGPTRWVEVSDTSGWVEV